MKNRNVLFLLPFLIFSLSFSGCSFVFSSTSQPGTSEVDVCYQIYIQAIASGFKGTYEEWLASMKGVDGASLLTGLNNPENLMGKNGDTYINTTSWDVFVKSDDIWSKVGNILGPKGDNGQDGHTSVINTSENDYWAVNDVKLIGHRGFSGLAPENTLPSFWKAAEYGYWGAECDIRETSDGYFVLMHDATVDRTTDGTGTIDSMTLAEIQALNIDSGTNIEFYPELKVPTLEEYLHTCKTYGIVPIIETKNHSQAICEKLYDIIKKWGMESQCIIISFNISTIEALRKLSENLFLQPLLDLSMENIDYCASLGKNTGIDCAFTTLTTELVEYAHSKGVMVNCWTVDYFNEIVEYVRMGVDFITTNNLMFNNKLISENIVTRIKDGTKSYIGTVGDINIGTDVVLASVKLKYTSGNPPVLTVGTTTLTAESKVGAWQYMKIQCLASSDIIGLVADGDFSFTDFKITLQKM